MAIDSVNGSAANAGTLYAPKQSLAQPLNAIGSVVGLYRGSLFRASVPLASLGTTHGVAVQDVALGSVRPLPVVSAFDLVTNSACTANGDGTYTYLWTAAETLTQDGYSNVYAVEVNTAAEAATPIAARQRMIDVTSQAACVSTPGSVWVQAPGTGAGQSGSSTQWAAVFHPSDSTAPGGGAYRYEVISRLGPLAWSVGNTGDGAAAGLTLVGSNNGYGSLGGPVGFVGDRLVLLHCTTHTAVIGGGSLQRSVFYEMGDSTAIQLAWYTPSPAGVVSFDMRACLFYTNAGTAQSAARIPDSVLAHSGDGSNFARGDISDCAFLGARRQDGSLSGTAIGYNNVNTGVIDRCYVFGYQGPFGGPMPTTSEVKNSVFRSVYLTMVSGSFHDNLVAAEGLLLANDPQYLSAVGWQFRANGAAVTNNLFWVHGLPAAANDNQANGFSVYPGVTTGTAQRNIVVLDPATPATPAAYTQGQIPAGVSLDYNLIINTATTFATPNNGNVHTWASYRANTPAQDAHSLYVDLSADPRGLKAVFMDPANGDFRWAQTDVARQCAAYCRANGVGPATVTSRWPTVPTVDEAARMLAAV